MLNQALTVPAADFDERNVFAFKRERPKSQTWRTHQTGEGHATYLHTEMAVINLRVQNMQK